MILNLYNYMNYSLKFTYLDDRERQIVPEETIFLCHVISVVAYEHCLVNAFGSGELIYKFACVGRKSYFVCNFDVAACYGLRLEVALLCAFLDEVDSLLFGSVVLAFNNNNVFAVGGLCVYEYEEDCAYDE